MKKNVINLMLSLLIITLASCSSKTEDSKLSEYDSLNGLDGVTMRVDEQSISSKGLKVIFQNDTNDKEIVYGDPFILEISKDNKWYEVPIKLKDNYGFNDIGYEVPPNTSSEWDVDWEWLYGSLDEGDYRMIKDVSDFREPGDFEVYSLSAPFTIK